MSSKQKPIIWHGAAKDELTSFPDDVQDVMGFALHLAQIGERPENAAPMRGYTGGTVLAIHDDHDGDTYRTMYIAEFPEAVYVLYAIKKKSTEGIGLSLKDTRTLNARHKAALEARAAKLRQEKK